MSSVYSVVNRIHFCFVTLIECQSTKILKKQGTGKASCPFLSSKRHLRDQRAANARILPRTACGIKHKYYLYIVIRKALMYYRKKTFYESKKHFIMAVPVMRYQRYKDLSDKSSPQKYYLKQEPGSSKTATIASIAKEIEITGALSAEDVTHVMQAFVRQLKKSLVEGNKVKVDGLGTFYITLTSAGTETEKECTVKGIRRVHIRFAVDNSLRLANDSTATTRGGENNVSFYIKSETPSGDGGDGDIVDDPTA